jgi:hypothetical protein
MKKIHIYIILSVLIAGFLSCKDNDAFSGLHNLTAAETAEIARQDSVAEAQKNYINANLKLEYTVEINTSKSLYDGAPVTVEVDKIAQLFGISKADLLAGIAGESGAPEIKGFVIQGSTHEDKGSSSNTNAPWGHWWDRRGDLSAWGDSAMVFAEFDTESSVFNIGQYPGHLKDGQTIKIIECLKYNEKRAAVIITIKAKGPAKLNATVVGTQDLTINVTAKSSYDADSVKFDLKKALADLGMSSMNDVKYVGVNQDGSYEQEPVTVNGFWYDMKGFVGAYGNNSSVFTEHSTSSEYIRIGQYPDHLTGDQELVIKYGFLANNKIELFNITIKVAGYQDPETKPSGNPTAVLSNIVLNKVFSNDYASITTDVKETLRDAFKMTTYQIHKAIGSGELKLYQGTVTGATPTYTADPAPAYWLKADGTVGPYAEGVVFCGIGHSETTLDIFCGNHPANAVAGSSIKTVLIATCNGGSVFFNITINIVEPGSSVEKTYDVNETYNAEYAPTVTDVTDVLTNGLGLTAAEIGAAIDNQTLIFKGLNANGSVYVDADGKPAQTANYPGHWFAINGDVVGWGAESIFYSELRYENDKLVFNQGHHPENAKVGQKTTIKQVVTVNNKEVVLTFNLKIVE